MAGSLYLGWPLGRLPEKEWEAAAARKSAQGWGLPFAETAALALVVCPLPGEGRGDRLLRSAVCHLMVAIGGTVIGGTVILAPPRRRLGHRGRWSVCA